MDTGMYDKDGQYVQATAPGAEREAEVKALARELEKYEAGLIPDPRVKALAAELAAVAERASGEGKDPLEAMAARCIELVDAIPPDVGPGFYVKDGDCIRVRRDP